MLLIHDILGKIQIRITKKDSTFFKIEIKIQKVPLVFKYRYLINLGSDINGTKTTLHIKFFLNKITLLTFLIHLGKFSLQHNGNSLPLCGILELPNKQYVEEGGDGCCQHHAAQNLPLLHVKIEHRCSQQRRWGLFGSTSSGIRMKPPRSWCQKY